MLDKSAHHPHHYGMTPTPLTATEQNALATTLPQWRIEGTALVRDYKFADFSAAWAFMARVALLAEKHDHHPDWSNSYNRVRIALTTHEAASLSSRDVSLARAIDALG